LSGEGGAWAVCRNVTAGRVVFSLSLDKNGLHTRYDSSIFTAGILSYFGVVDGAAARPTFRPRPYFYVFPPLQGVLNASLFQRACPCTPYETCSWLLRPPRSRGVTRALLGRRFPVTLLASPAAAHATPALPPHPPHVSRGHAQSRVRCPLRSPLLLLLLLLAPPPPPPLPLPPLSAPVAAKVDTAAAREQQQRKTWPGRA
jgi:hypothetical protein